MTNFAEQFKKLILFITLDNGNFQFIDLRNEENFFRQEKNIEQFQTIRSKFILFIALFLVCFVISASLFDVLFKLFGHFWIVFNFLSTIPIFWYLFKYKCPNCMQIVDGKSYDISSGIEASKGLRLFPSRCHCCGFYLSKSALIYDFDLQSKELI